jgi:uncharacterized protein (DUF433 family)
MTYSETGISAEPDLVSPTTNGALAKVATSCDAGNMEGQVVIDPGICHGKPVVRGTRMPVSLIVGSLAGGMGFEDVEREYGLTQSQIRAALKFAGELVEQEEHHALAHRVG